MVDVSLVITCMPEKPPSVPVTKPNLFNPLFASCCRLFLIVSSLSCLIWFWSPFLLWLFLTCSSSRPDPVCLCPASVRGLDTEGGFSLYTCVVQRWGTEEVAVWLEQLSLGEYKETFIRHDIRGSELLHLERRDLKVYTQPLSVPHDVPQNNRNALSLSISLFDSLSLSSYLSPCLLFCAALLCLASTVQVSFGSPNTYATYRLTHVGLL